MSTKTTFKRIALVAVASLGFGVLTSVAPASAATTVTSITAGTTPAARAGSSIIVPITVALSASTGSESLTVAVKTISAPTSGGLANAASVHWNAANTYQKTFATSLVAMSDSAGAVLGSFQASGSAGDVTDDTTYAGTWVAGTTTAGNITATPASGGVPATAVQIATTTAVSYTTYVKITPDLPGTYTFLASVSTTAGNLSYAAGDISSTFTVTTSGAPTTAVFTNIGGSSATNFSGTYGALYRLSFTDAAGVATTLSGDEAFTITPSDGLISKATGASSATFASVAPASASVTFSSSDMSNGVGFFNAQASAVAKTVVLTGNGSGTLSSTVSTAASFATATGAGDTPIATTFAGGVGWYLTTTIPSTSTSNTMKLTYTGATTADYGFLQITDNQGKISGAPSTSTLIYDRAYTQAALSEAAATSVSIAIPHAVCATTSTCYTVADSGGTSGDVTVTSALSAITTGATLVATPESVRMATGGTVSVSALLKDQFGVAKANTSVTVTVAGRNSAKASTTLVSDADGYVTYSFTDTGTSGTADVITLTAGSPASDTVAITYGTATAGSVLVTTPNTLSTGADEYPAVAEDISAGDGVEAGAVTVTALVKDADGNVMAGIPVTWTIAGTGVAITSTTTSSYTDAAGTVTASVYGWVAGTYTVTATAGGKSDDAPVIFAQNTPTEVRTLSATTEGNTLTVTAKDRLGNVVANVPVKATRTAGTGNFGGSSSATGTTDENGTASFDVSNGAATVKVTFNDAAASTYGQSDALEGLIDGTTATDTFTAYTAGTAITAEEGVGASFAAAGVNSVTVEVNASDTAQAAADAAAEATDAANAATDAANAAAEAADAATAAAQDAADAVAALSTEVTELISALRKQITSLTNLVIKIQKKVKA